jgi:hypothetical protein
MSEKPTSAQLEEAEMQAVRDERAAAIKRRYVNAGTDVSPAVAATALAEWITDSEAPESCRAEGTKLDEGSFKTAGISASGGKIDMASDAHGAAVWQIVPMNIDGKRYSMLIGAVKLHNDQWSLFRRVLEVNGPDVVYAHDQKWFDSRRSRTRRKRGS